MGSIAQNQMTNALRNLTFEQRLLIRAHLPSPGQWGGAAREGWSIYRIPSIGNPPHTLRLHYRNGAGRLSQVISITEDGVTKMPDRVISMMKDKIEFLD